jgi:Winged helix DNA-binding domain
MQTPTISGARSRPRRARALHSAPVRTLTRKELTAALAERQLLRERVRLDPAEAIRVLTPLQAQDPPAPYVALAARLEGFERTQLEAAIDAGAVVKTTIMRLTLHLAAAVDYPAYHRLSTAGRMRGWRRQFAHLDEEKVVRDLRTWLGQPRTNAEIREHLRARYDGIEADWRPIWFARNVLPLVQLPPAGHWDDARRPSFVVDTRPLPSEDKAATRVLEGYLRAFGPASRNDVKSWSGAAQRDFSAALERLETVTYRDEKDVELFDLPGTPLPPPGVKLPPRFLSRWDQPLLAYADRDRIIPPELQPLKLTQSGDQTITVDGRVAASWKLERSARLTRVLVIPHRDIPRRAHAGIRFEGKRTARFCEPAVDKVEVAGL